MEVSSEYLYFQIVILLCYRTVMYYRNLLYSRCIFLYSNQTGIVDNIISFDILEMVLLKKIKHDVHENK